MSKWILSLFLLGCMVSIAVGQDIVFNEVMSLNTTNLLDEDSEYADWIEFYNTGNTTVNLEGFGFSDDINDPYMWVFPHVELEAGEFLVVFASDKDRRLWSAHFETIVDWGDTYAYMLGNSDISRSWNLPSFNDTLMPRGPSGLGRGDDDDATIISPTISLYIRNTFAFESVESVISTHLSVDYDDAFVAYLNGVEIARSNIGTPGILPEWDEYSIRDYEARLYRGFPPEHFHIEDPQTLIQDGDNLLAIQVHNADENPFDMTIIPFLTFGMTTPPPNPRGLSTTLNSNALLNLHTNFKINASGETIVLTDPDGNTVDSVTVGEMLSDFSYGRQPDGEQSWFHFDEPTPRNANTSPGYTGFADPPNFSIPGGFFADGTIVSLSASHQATVRYTLDGAEPTLLSEEYDSPIEITDSQVIRAVAFEPGLLASTVITNSYIVRDDFMMPVASISTDPEHLWDEEVGLFENIYSEMEYPANIEFFEIEGNLCFNHGFGVRLHGGSGSLHMDQKSLAIQFRSQYGTTRLENYQLFPSKPIDSFKSFLLRNSGNDFPCSKIRDAVMTGLVDHTDVDIQAFQPVTVYLNGEYWGIMNMREKISEHYVESNRGFDSNDVDLLDQRMRVYNGDADHYQAMLDFIEVNDLSIQTNYEYIKTGVEHIGKTVNKVSLEFKVFIQHP